MTTSEKVQSLLAMYDQLDQNHHQHNTVIHQTFYLSVVFVGALLSVIVPADLTDELTAVTAAFTAFVMFVLGVWTLMYVRGRREIKDGKDELVNELENYEDQLNVSMEDIFFFRHDDTWADSILDKLTPDSTEMTVEKIKGKFEWGYYFVVGTALLLFAIVQVW